MNIAHPTHQSELPYSLDHLDSLMDAAGIDVLLATSKHNVRYLLGGYQFIFFSAMDAIGHSRYLPIFVYIKGEPDKSAFVANKMEAGEAQNRPFWVQNFFPATWTAVEAIETAASHLEAVGMTKGRVGLEPSFLPVDAFQTLSNRSPGLRPVDATNVLEKLRAVKTPTELTLLKEATELISDAMIATIASAREGTSKHEIFDQLRKEEAQRNLMFEYCLLTLGDSHNRAASNQKWKSGEMLSIDSGGNYHGYIGDICRVGFLGEPDDEMEDLLAQVEQVQQAAFSKIKAGARGGELVEYAQATLASLECCPYTDFFGHGMGLITHEAPFLLTNHPVTYEGTDADEPLRSGMVLSIETTMLHPTRGYVKLEDTVAVTDEGFELFGAEGRGWNPGGIR